MTDKASLYDFPSDYVGRKTYVSVRGHSRSVPYLYTYRGRDGRNYVLPEFGGEDIGGEVSGSAAIMRDIGEYTSVVDGSHISSRSQHRDHIRRHDLVEIGNERMPARREESIPRIGGDIKRAIDQLRART